MSFSLRQILFREMVSKSSVLDTNCTNMLYNDCLPDLFDVAVNKEALPWESNCISREMRINETSPRFRT
ncbi:hypothetical protein EUGRSUZ_C03294 [Eucalyptus grandis]|uniref:Uncharacterized protein n=2 Tax=Eucalyptus grandis TaxID=71139 RepID=A0ACC3LIH4_EUCGR|nr:hypothetical protein EUGRSUZ_C03294 [Eucalyptus grandis]